jgi:hypothetical protein
LLTRPLGGEFDSGVVAGDEVAGVPVGVGIPEIVTFDK